MGCKFPSCTEAHWSLGTRNKWVYNWSERVYEAVSSLVRWPGSQHTGNYFCQSIWTALILQPCGLIPESCRDTWGILQHAKKEVWVPALKSQRAVILNSVTLELSWSQPSFPPPVLWSPLHAVPMSQIDSLGLFPAVLLQTPRNWLRVTESRCLVARD